jgi:cell wall-associated NlpC family hydrolase
MKKIIFIILVMLMTIQIYSQEKSMKKIQNTILEMKEKYAPDKRVAIFNIEAKDDEGKISLIGETTELDAKEELLSILNDAKIKIADKINTLPEDKLKEKTLGLVDVSVANLRAEPRHSAELVTQAILGTPIRVLKKHDGFCLIQTPDKYIAWVDDDGIFEVDKDEYDNWYNSDKIIYIKEYGFSYSEANENSERVSDLVIGNILVKIGSEGKFVKVKYPDGRTAFVVKTEVQNFKQWLSNAYPTKENIISTAKLFMGNPYLWGGTSAKGLDCSGFTKTVYYLNGVLLDRDASQQVKKGELVDTENNFSNLEKGDLLFFGSKAKEGKKERITHVGIYIDNMEFIHEAGKVKYNSFDKEADNFSAYRLKNFIRAKRIISSVGENGIELISDNEFYNGKLK